MFDRVAEIVFAADLNAIPAPTEFRMVRAQFGPRQNGALRERSGAFIRNETCIAINFTRAGQSCRIPPGIL